MERLKDKVVIITGAGHGIGRWFAQGCALEGANVVIVDIDEDGAKTAQTDLSKIGASSITIKSDISKKQDCEFMVELVREKFKKIDVLVNNAAVFSSIPVLRGRPMEEIAIEEWDRIMNTNLRGTFLCCQAVVPTMKRQKKGRIINISSSIVYVGTGYYPHYIASKAGVIGLTRALARELGEWDITVNAIAPGGTLSEEVPDISAVERRRKTAQRRSIKRIETPEDLLGALVFFASDESSFITGQTLVVDGGDIMR
jgi:3-oxoacyl-[acyl-carrier protein] reductase